VDDLETGFLVPPREPVALAARIVQLLKDQALSRRMGRAGLERVQRLFTVERMVEETAAAYQQLVETLRRSSPGGTQAF
jgi:glycosyltransferase involved in cell wall biosynthesis